MRFVQQQERSFALANRVREFLIRAGAVDVEISPEAFANLGFGEVIEKPLFVTGGMPLDWNEYGCDAAFSEQLDVYRKLIDVDEPATTAVTPLPQNLQPSASCAPTDLSPTQYSSPITRTRGTQSLGLPSSST